MSKASAGVGSYEFTNGQGVEYVVSVEIENIFSGNHIDFLVPFRIELAEKLELFTLFSREVWEIFVYNVHGFGV